MIIMMLTARRAHSFFAPTPRTLIMNPRLTSSTTTTTTTTTTQTGHAWMPSSLFERLQTSVIAAAATMMGGSRGNRHENEAAAAEEEEQVPYHHHHHHQQEHQEPAHHTQEEQVAPPPPPPPPPPPVVYATRAPALGTAMTVTNLHAPPGGHRRRSSPRPESVFMSPGLLGVGYAVDQAQPSPPLLPPPGLGHPPHGMMASPSLGAVGGGGGGGSTISRNIRNNGPAPEAQKKFCRATRWDSEEEEEDEDEVVEVEDEEEEKGRRGKGKGKEKEQAKLPPRKSLARASTRAAAAASAPPPSSAAAEDDKKPAARGRKKEVDLIVLSGNEDDEETEDEAEVIPSRKNDNNKKKRKVEVTGPKKVEVAEEEEEDDEVEIVGGSQDAMDRPRTRQRRPNLDTSSMMRGSSSPGETVNLCTSPTNGWAWPGGGGGGGRGASTRTRGPTEVGRLMPLSKAKQKSEEETEAEVMMDSCLTFLLQEAETPSFAAARAMIGEKGEEEEEEEEETKGKGQPKDDRKEADSSGKKKEEDEEEDGGGGGGKVAAEEEASPPLFPPPPPSPPPPAKTTKKKGAATAYQFSEEQLKDVMLRLCQDVVLSDEVLNRALDMLAKAEVARNVILFNTFWYTKIKDGLYDEARQWLKRALGERDRKKLRLVCVPINISNVHWVLVFADLDRKTVQEWDPASAEYPMDTSRINNIKDAIEKALDMEKDTLTVCPAPKGLPQQTDAINCGLFVVMYLIHLCFLRKREEDDGDDDHSARQVPDPPKIKQLAMTGFLNMLGKERALRSRGPVSPPRPRRIPSCTFPVSKEEMFRYRVFLLTWILHSQLSYLPRTDPVLLSFIQEPLVLSAEGAVVASGGHSPTSLQDRRRLLYALVKDTVNSEPMQRRLLDESMALLNKFTDGTVVFLRSEWYRCLAKRDAEGALACMGKETTGHDMNKLEAFCVPIHHAGAGGWLLARVDLQAELKSIELHGTQALGDAEPVFAVLEAGLRHIFAREEQWKRRMLPLVEVPQSHQVPVALVQLAMHTCRNGLAGWGKEVRLGFDQPPRYFASKVAILRFLLRHTDGRLAT